MQDMLARYLLDKVLEKWRKTPPRTTGISEEIQEEIMTLVEKGLSQNEVAQKIGKSRASVQNIVRLRAQREDKRA